MDLGAYLDLRGIHPAQMPRGPQLMNHRPLHLRRTLAAAALFLGALTQAQATGSTYASLVNETLRKVRVTVTTASLSHYDPSTPHVAATARVDGWATLNLEGYNPVTKAPVLHLGIHSRTLTSAVLGPGECIEFTSRPGYNTLQTLDLTVQEESSGSNPGPGPAAVFRYWAWETEIDPDGMACSGGILILNPGGPGSFTLANRFGRLAAIIDASAAQPTAPGGLLPEPGGLLPEPKGLLPEPKGLLPEPKDATPLYLPPVMVQFLQAGGQTSQSSTSTSSSSSSSTSTPTSSPSSSSSSTTPTIPGPSQPAKGVAPGGL